MAAFFGILILVLFVTAAVAIVRLVWRWLTTPMPATQRAAASPAMSAEEEGNVHSGPYGYSPETAYPQTQYGSLFNPDAEWNHEEND